MRAQLFFAVILILSSSMNVYSQEDYTLKELTASGNYQVELVWPDIQVDKISKFVVRFVDPSNDELMQQVNFDLLIMQGENLIENYHDEIADGIMVLEVLFIDTGSATIDVTIKSVGKKEVGEKTSFSVNVVPEFPLVLAAVMGISMLMVIALRLNPITKVSQK